MDKTRHTLGWKTIKYVEQIGSAQHNPAARDAKDRLDEAVFAAYGRQSDLSDEEILAMLLALNLERARFDAIAWSAGRNRWPAGTASGQSH